MEEDWDEELFADGTVAWAKPYDRPWWPTVMFSSWDAARRWAPPGGRAKIRVLGRPEPIRAHEALGYLLGDGSLQVFDRRTYEVQDWDYISPEAVLATTLSNRAAYNDSDSEEEDDTERDPLRRAFSHAVEEAYLALPLCGRAPDAARRFIDLNPRRGRWERKRKRGDPKRKHRQPNLLPNAGFDILRNNNESYVFSPHKKKAPPEPSRPLSQRATSPRVLDAYTSVAVPARPKPRQARPPRRESLPPKKRGRPAGKRPSALATLAAKRPRRPPSPSPEPVVTLAPSSHGRARSVPLKMREAAAEVDLDEAAEERRRARPEPRPVSPPSAAKRKPGRPRSGKTLWTVGDRVFSRVVGTGWVPGTVAGLLMGRRVTDDMITIMGDDGVARDVRAPLARKRAPLTKAAHVVSPPGSSAEDSSKANSDDSSSRSCESLET